MALALTVSVADTAPPADALCSVTDSAERPIEEPQRMNEKTAPALRVLECILCNHQHLIPAFDGPMFTIWF
jgi:hypothetical protein